MSASSSKLNSLTVKENVAATQTLKIMVPKEANNNKGRDDLSQEKKACHQCRQKTANLGGACKSKRNRNKGPCPIRYCARCLLNRYGKQEKVAQMEDRWICPKCRGICNCSCCRKKRGEMPTGRLIHVAKASGCASVHDLLQKGSEAVAAAHVDGAQQLFVVSHKGDCVAIRELRRVAGFVVAIPNSAETGVNGSFKSTETIEKILASEGTIIGEKSSVKLCKI